MGMLEIARLCPSPLAALFHVQLCRPVTSAWAPNKEEKVERRMYKMLDVFLLSDSTDVTRAAVWPLRC